jgi:hypothetical protein
VRFLNRLKADTMIVTEPTRDATLITICNYEKYQSSRNASETQTETPSETEVKRSRNKEEENKQSNNQQIKKETPLRVDDWPADFGDAFWRAYPRKAEKLAAMKKLANLRKSGIVTFTDLIAGVGRYAASVSNTEPKYIKQPTTWLNAGCWADEISEGGFNGHGFSNNRTNPVAGSSSTRDAAIIAGMDRTIEKRHAARAADDPGRPDVREERCSGAPGGDDANRGSTAGDDRSSGQLAFLPAGYPGQ